MADQKLNNQGIGGSGKKVPQLHRDSISTTDSWSFTENIQAEHIPSRGQKQLNNEQQKALDKWVQTLLAQNKIQLIAPEKVKHILSTVVIGDRITHNCQDLYPYIAETGRFPQGQAVGPIVLWSIGKAHLAKIDLTKAFHTIPLHPSQRPYYCFEHKGKYYQYNCMPMGAKTAPKHFHTVIRNILAQLPFCDDIRNYQDDIIITAKNHTELVTRYNLTRQLLQQYNFKVNEEKSELPAQTILGYNVMNKISIPPAKQQWLNKTLDSDPAKAIHSLLYYRLLHKQYQIEALQKGLKILKTRKSLPPSYIKAIRAWSTNSIPNRPLQHKFKLFVDASNKGTGLVLKKDTLTILVRHEETKRLHNLANDTEAANAYKILAKYWKQIKDAIGTEKLTFYTDNALLARNLQRHNWDHTSLAAHYAEKIYYLLQPHTSGFHHIHGRFNPADKPSRRQNTSKLRRRRSISLNNTLQADYSRPHAHQDGISLSQSGSSPTSAPFLARENQIQASHSSFRGRRPYEHPRTTIQPPSSGRNLVGHVPYNTHESMPHNDRTNSGSNQNPHRLQGTRGRTKSERLAQQAATKTEPDESGYG